MIVMHDLVRAVGRQGSGTTAPPRQADLHPLLTALQAPQSLLLLLLCGGIWLRRPRSRDAAGAQSMQVLGFRLLDAAIACRSPAK